MSNSPTLARIQRREIGLNLAPSRKVSAQQRGPEEIENACDLPIQFIMANFRNLPREIRQKILQHAFPQALKDDIHLNEFIQSFCLRFYELYQE